MNYKLHRDKLLNKINQKDTIVCLDVQRRQGTTTVLNDYLLEYCRNNSGKNVYYNVDYYHSDVERCIKYLSERLNIDLRNQHTNVNINDNFIDFYYKSDKKYDLMILDQFNSRRNDDSPVDIFNSPKVIIVMCDETEQLRKFEYEVHKDLIYKKLNKKDTVICLDVKASHEKMTNSILNDYIMEYCSSHESNIILYHNDMSTIHIDGFVDSVVDKIGAPPDITDDSISFRKNTIDLKYDYYKKYDLVIFPNYNEESHGDINLGMVNSPKIIVTRIHGIDILASGDILPV
jgi:hypothetical protein